MDSKYTIYILPQAGGPKAEFDRQINNLTIINFSVSNINKKQICQKIFSRI